MRTIRFLSRARTAGAVGMLLLAALGLWLAGCMGNESPTEPPGSGSADAAATSESGLRFGPFPGSPSIFVDVANTTGIEDGSRSQPFKTIGKALRAAKSGDIVGVAPGVYAETFGPGLTPNYVIDGLRNFQLLGSGAARTTIRGNHSFSLIQVRNGASVLIRGFTIEHGGKFLNSEGGGIQAIGRPDSVSLTVENVILQDNEAVNGGAISAEGRVALRLVNVLIANNRASNCCGGVVLAGGDGRVSGSLKNTTITANAASYLAGGVLVELDATLTLVNSIVWNNSLAEVAKFSGQERVSVSFSDVGEKLFPGSGNRSSDPRFADPIRRDYRLRWNSPAVDAGTNTGAPLTDLYGRTRPLDGDGDGQAVTDMGALERIAKSAIVTLTFRQVSAGTFHTCAVATDDRAYCWGLNVYGELGDGTKTGTDICEGLPCKTRPVAVVGGLRFREVAVGGSHTCGVTQNDSVYCWGLNLGGQLGNGTFFGPETCTQNSYSCSTRPVAVVGGVHFRQLSLGGGHTCGLTTGHRAYCWGGNFDGQLGDSSHVLGRNVPVQVAGEHHYRQLDAGANQTCAVTMGHEAFCWGDGRLGAVGDGETALTFWPRLVSRGLRFSSVTAGDEYTCGLTTEDRAYCWGLNSTGELGNGTYTGPQTCGDFACSTRPAAVTGGLSFTQLTAGSLHTCGKTSADVAYCWGYNLEGAVGDGTQSLPRTTPTAVAGGLMFGQFSAGWHTCGVTPAGVAYCWGSNLYGALGDGTTTNRLTPTAVVAPT